MLSTPRATTSRGVTPRGTASRTRAATALLAVVALSACGSGSSGSGSNSAATTPSAATSPPVTPAVTASSTNEQAAFTVREFDSTSDSGWTATFQVLSSPAGNILIGPGKYDAEVADYVKSIGGVDAIMITHGHWDKLRGLDAAMKANPKAVAWIHELDQPYLHDPKCNCSIEEGVSRTTDAKTSTFTESTTTIAGHRVQLIHLPGHTEGSTVFWFPDDNTMIGGDTIMSAKVGSASHPGGNEASRTASIAKFKKLHFTADARVYNGHAEPTTYAQLTKSNTDLA